MTQRIFGDRLALFILFLAAWEATARLWGDMWVSSPLLTAEHLFDVVAGGQIFRHAWFTLQAAFWGFVIGGVPAVILPFVLRRFPKVTAVLDPFLAGGYGMPKLALAPLFILWFGVGMDSKIALVASMTFFLLFFNTHGGVQSVNVQLLNMARVAGASERHIARYIVWPAAVPSIFAGLRISAPHAVGGAVIGEVISSDRGLGFMIQSAATDFDTTGVVTALAVLTVMVVVIYYGVDRIERRLLSWRPAELGMRRMISSMS